MKQKIIKLTGVLLATALVFLGAGTYKVLASASWPLLENAAISGKTTKEERETAQQRLKDLQAELADLRTQIDDLANRIKSGKDAANAARQQKAALEKEAILIEQQIVLKRGEIEFKDAEIAAKIEEIDVKQEEFDVSEDFLIQRLVAVYKTNNSSLMSTLLNIDDFSDFMVLTENLQRISSNDSTMLDKLEAEKAELEAAKTELENMMANLVVARESLDQLLTDYQTNIAAQVAKVSALMAQVAQDEAEKLAAVEAVEAYQKEMEEVFASLDALDAEYIGGALLWPVPEYNGKQFISSIFGNRTLYGRPNFHTGTDVAGGKKGGIQGKEIVAANAGLVVMVSTGNARTGYGYYAIIDHGGGIKTLYAHCASINVQKGEMVYKGQAIATVGNTGNSTGPHLHFELRIDNKAVNAMPYLDGTKSLG